MKKCHILDEAREETDGVYSTCTVYIIHSFHASTIKKKEKIPSLAQHDHTQMNKYMYRYMYMYACRPMYICTGRPTSCARCCITFVRVHAVRGLTGIGISRLNQDRQGS